jgi:serine/threonine protein kinase
VQKLCREVLVWQHLRHPFLLPFVGLLKPFSVFATLPYIVSEYAPNGTLHDFIKTDGYMPWIDSLRLVSKLHTR